MTSPLSTVSSAPWWLTLPTGSLLVAFVSGHSKPVIMWLWHRFISEAASAETREARLAELSMKMVDQGQEDARDLRKDLASARSGEDTERKRADAERASGQKWYYKSRAMEGFAHDLRHVANNQLTDLAGLLEKAGIAFVLKPLPKVPALDEIEL